MQCAHDTDTSGHFFRLVLQRQPYTSSFCVFTLGRAPDMVDVQIEHPSCSRIHCVVQHRKSGEVYLYDMQSAHGTFLNKKQLPPREYVPLHVGDMVQFGGSTRLYHLTGPEV